MLGAADFALLTAAAGPVAMESLDVSVLGPDGLRKMVNGLISTTLTVMFFGAATTAATAATTAQQNVEAAQERSRSQTTQSPPPPARGDLIASAVKQLNPAVTQMPMDPKKMDALFDVLVETEDKTWLGSQRAGGGPDEATQALAAVNLDAVNPDEMNFSSVIALANPLNPDTSVYQGAWSSAVAKQAKAGLLLEINLQGTMFAEDSQRSEFVDALGSAQCRVQALEMAAMELGEEGGVAVGKMLATNTSVTDINLACNKIGDIAGTALAEALKVNTTLTFIDLDGNKLGDVAGTALAEALKVNTALTDIYLRANDDLLDATKEVIKAAVADRSPGLTLLV